MNLLNKLTITNLKLNKKRTIVTIIGIILATALITAVAGMVTSFRQTIVDFDKKHDGNYHYRFCDVPQDELKYIKNNRNIESYYITQEIGYSKLEGSENDYKPYLYISSYDSKALTDSSIKLIEGKMPQNENEVVISEHIITNGKVNYKIGQKLTLDIGTRLSNESELGQKDAYTKNSETIKTSITKTYEIVGIIERPNTTIEPTSAPGYSVITYLDDNKIEGKADIYSLYTKKGLRDRFKVTSDILGVSDELLEKSIKGTITESEYGELTNNAKYKFSRNKDLLRFEILDFNESNLSMIYTLSVIVIAIIIVTSIFCIRNSFAISITEKMKQYGMLASIGATSKQIKKNVYYEALILSVISIPLGILSGMLAIFILLKVISVILAEGLNGIVFVYSVPWTVIIIGIALSLITIFLSARKSAKRASKVSPIEAIRVNSDIKIKSKKLRSPKIIKKLFGIGGEIAYKNLKRNKSKYRTTVISIVVSIAIFIPMSTFMNYAFKTASIYYRECGYNLAVSTDISKKSGYEELKKISALDEVEKYSIQRSVLFNIDIKEMKYTEKGKKYLYEENVENGSSEESVIINAYSLGKDEYNRYIKQLGFKYENVKNKAIVVNNALKYVKNDNGKHVNEKFEPYEYRAGDNINAKLMKDNAKDRNVQIEVAKVTDKVPMGLEDQYYDGYIIVSDEWIESNSNYLLKGMNLYIKCDNADNLEDNIKTVVNKSDVSIYNVESNARQQNAMWMVIAIFLYGFITVISLIGVTNIFNTITTNMNLRSKEFANLKSIGMSKTEFNRMIRLESIFYGTKSLLIGLPIGIGLSYAMYIGFGESVEMGFLFPTAGVIISILAVFILIISIMKYSLNKINKQNIIETIRKDNI